MRWTDDRPRSHVIIGVLQGLTKAEALHLSFVKRALWIGVKRVFTVVADRVL
jgi:predicted HTH transcriptional regulator